MAQEDYKTLYIAETEETMSALENGLIAFEDNEDVVTDVNELFRHAHNMKGMSGAMGYDLVVEASHTLENVLARFKNGEIEVSPARVDVLLRAVDIIGNLNRHAVDEGPPSEGSELLAQVVELLSPMLVESDGNTTATDCTNTGDKDGEPTTASPADEPADSSRLDGDEAGAAGMARAAQTAKADYHPVITSTRVTLEKLDKLMGRVGELITSRTRLGSLAEESGSRVLEREFASFARLSNAIQRDVMELRLVPVGQVFKRFKRLVRDLSRETKKDVSLDIVGGDIGLDKSVLETVVDPLIHVIRNCVDHGIESPSERKALGKPERATIVLSARRERDSVILAVSDDGRGIDVEKIRKISKPAEASEDFAEQLADDDICRIVSMPGFSTSDGVDHLSGRGMGMHIVKVLTESLGGSLSVSSKPGEGTTVSLKLPISLAITRALLFYVGGHVHALPIDCVQETSRVERGALDSVRGRFVYKAKGIAVPVVRPRDVFGMTPEETAERYIRMIVVDTDAGSVALSVDKILGQQDLVIKALPPMMRGVKGISGAAILGNGDVAFVWDPNVFFEEVDEHELARDTVTVDA
jgi:two-component system chemotaxis sensor kinase CheA